MPECALAILEGEDAHMAYRALPGPRCGRAALRYLSGDRHIRGGAAIMGCYGWVIIK